MNDEQDYDVVIDVLTKHRDALWKMTEQNMKSEYLSLNIMDDIRIRHIEDINRALDMWKVYKVESEGR